VWTSRREIVWRRVLALFAGVMVGIPIGTIVLDRSDPSLLLLVLGVFLVAAGALFMAFPTRRPRRLPYWLSLPVGLVSGVLTGLFGTGGPPLVLYHQFSNVDKAVFRGNLMAIFLLMTVVRVPSYAAVGLITAPRLLAASAILPAVLLGAWIGHRIHLRLEEQTFRRLVSLALVVIGLLLLARLYG
jgi:uncharacterized membrane protein YfcA